MKHTPKKTTEIIRPKQWLMHAIAQCADCDFEDDDYQSAQTIGRIHHIKTGHKVTIETGYCQIYESKVEGE